MKYGQSSKILKTKYFVYISMSKFGYLFLLSCQPREQRRHVSLPRGDVGLSAVGDCGIS